MSYPETQPGPQQLSFDERADPTVNPLAGAPVHELEGLITFMGQEIGNLPDGETDPNNPLHANLANGLRNAKAALAEARDKADGGREGAESSAHDKVNPTDVGKYALRNDGGVEIVSEAGAAQIDAGGSPSPENVWSSLAATNREPARQSAVPRASQPWGGSYPLGGRTRRRVQP